MRREHRVGACFLLVLILVYWWLRPGLDGIFLLDDVPNLKPLELVTEPLNPMHIVRFVQANEAGISRVISLASFAFQASDWPVSPHRFKAVNLLLHLLNGGLLYLTFYRLAALHLGQKVVAAWVALLSATVWLLHPLNFSTVFYVVQRMSELSATFTLVGLLLYLRGRGMVVAGRSFAGYAWATGGLLAGTVLAALSKETGALLPLYVLVIELTLLHEQSPGGYWKKWMGLCLVLPVLAISGYLLLHMQELIVSGYQQRSFSLAERLMTQPRVLWTYIGQIYSPQGADLGVFHDDYPVSKSLVHPISTGVAIVALCIVVAAAFVTRKKSPLLAFGVFWFLAGHLLESSVIPLELFFEHRNYLAMAGLILATTLGGAELVFKPGIRLPKLLWPALGAGWLVLVSLVAWQQARLWGDPIRQSVAWAQFHPNSLRAQHHLAGMLLWVGQAGKSAVIYRRFAETDKGNPAGYLFWLAGGCHSADLPLPDRKTMLAVLREASQVPSGVIGALDGIVSAHEEGKCSRIAPEMLDEALLTLSDNPRIAFQSKLLVWLGRSAAAAGDVDRALSLFGKALSLHSSVEVSLLKVKALALGKRYREADNALSEAADLNRTHFSGIRRLSYERDIAQWRAALDPFLR